MNCFRKTEFLSLPPSLLVFMHAFLILEIYLGLGLFDLSASSTNQSLSPVHIGNDISNLKIVSTDCLVTRGSSYSTQLRFCSLVKLG